MAQSIAFLQMPPVPRRASVKRLLRSRQWAGGVRIHRPTTSLRRVHPSPLSCVHLCPAPPVHPEQRAKRAVERLARTRRFDCLAEATFRLRPARRAELRRDPNRGTLIRVRLFKHRLTTGTGYHSGRHTPCTVSAILRSNSHVGRTHWSEPARHVRGSRLAMVSIPRSRNDFRG